MKKIQLITAALCVSALLLGSCTTTTKKKKKSSSVVTSQSVSGSSATSPVGPTSSSSTTQPGPGPSSSTSVAPVVVNVTGVSLDATSITLTVGQTRKLVATVAPSNATDQSVVWSVKSGSSVEVAQDGTVTAKSAGSAVVQVKTNDQGKTAECQVTVNEPTPIEGWSAADKAIFAEALYGVDVPYMKVEGAVVEKAEELEHFVTYSGGTSSAQILSNYAAKFNATEWKLEQQEDSETGEAIQQWYGELETKNSAGETRYVAAFLFAMGEEEQSTTGVGTFYLSLYDPYNYSWAEIAEAVDYYASYYAGEEVSVPGVPDSFIDLIVFNESYAAYGQVNAQILVNADPTEAYATLLSNAGYAYEGEDSYGYAVWRLGDYSFSISFLYYDSYGILDWYLEQSEPTYTEWPAAKILELMEDNLPEIPAYEGGSSYQVLDYRDYGYGLYVDVYGDSSVISQAALDAYIAGLDSAVWESQLISDEDGDYYAVSALAEDSRVSFYVYYSAETEEYDACIEFQLVLANARSDVFPVTEISAFYTSQGVDPTTVFLGELGVPAETGYYEMDDSYVESYGEYIVYGIGSTAADIAAYKSAAETAGWTAVETAETEESYAKIDFTKEGVLASIELVDLNDQGRVALVYMAEEPAPEDWSAEQIASFQEHLHGVVPPFISEFSGLEWDAEYEEFSDYIVFGDVSASVAAKLLAAEWVDEGAGSGETEGYHYYSKDSTDGEGCAVAYIYVGEYSTYGTITAFGIYWYSDTPTPGGYGTEDEPLDCASAAVVIAADCPNHGDYTQEIMYVEGTIVSIGSYNSKGYYSNVTIQGEDGSQIFIYSLNTTETTLAKGYWIEVTGYGTNYNGNIQMHGDGSEHAYTSLVKFVPGEPPVVEGYKVDFSKTTNQSSNSYTSIWEATCADGNKVTVRNGNNNALGWTFVKFGNKSTSLVGSIETQWQVASCGSVVVEVTAVVASYPTTIYVFASDTAFTKLPTSYEGALGSATASVGDVTINLSSAVENKYIQVVFVSADGGSTNGKVSVQSVTFCPAA